MPPFSKRTTGLPPTIPSPAISNISPADGDISGDNANRVLTLRRTLSAANMYSKCADAIKKTSSAEHLPSLLSGAGAFDGIWSSIQRKTESVNDDVANAISDVTPPPPPPYIHPLVKRSASCLSEKSLEICTESLGSETGSDGFSSSELLQEEDKNDAVLVVAELEKEVGPTEEVLEAARPMRSVIKKAAGGAAGRPLPPPLPSLSSENLHMRSHRHDGRLVLEAVAVQGPRNCFRAERQGGRLLLTFSEIATSEEVAEGEGEGEGEGEDEQEEDLMEKEKAMINYVPYKFLCMTRSNNASLSWPERLNRAVTTLDEGDDDDRECSDAMLVPAMSAEANTGALLNQYIYSWRNKRTSSVDKVGELKKIVVEEVAKRGAMEVYDKLLPFLRGCNEVGEGKQQPRRSLMLLRDSRCIATS